MNKTIEIQSRNRDDWIDITGEVRAVAQASGLSEGVVTVFVPHTTAGVTIQENADPPLKDDISGTLAKLFPWSAAYGHCEDNAAAHIKAVVTGSSVQVPFAGGRLQLGTWQNIFVCDFDGPRRRRVILQVSG